MSSQITDEMLVKIQQFRFVNKELLHDVPDEFIMEFQDLMSQKVVMNKSLAEYIKLKYDVIRILFEEL